MTDNIRGRYFLVGCARSGTTLLQSLVASHSSIASFPETHFFSNLESNSRWVRTLGFPGRGLKQNFRKFSESLDRQGYRAAMPAILWPKSKLPQAFVNCLDDLAAQMSSLIWLEKTPMHVFQIDLIKRHVPDAKFIHIIRNSRDVVASLYEVTRKAPEDWGSPGGRSIEKCVAQWNRSIIQSFIHEGMEDHHIVYFDDLTDNPAACLQGVCKFLEVEYEREMLTLRKQQVNSLLTEGEFWKTGIGENKIQRDTRNRKFYELFTSSEQSFIDERTAVNMEKVETGYQGVRNSRPSIESGDGVTQE